MLSDQISRVFRDQISRVFRDQISRMFRDQDLMGRADMSPFTKFNNCGIIDPGLLVTLAGSWIRY